MFQFRAFPPYDYLIHRTVLEYCSSGFPHSEISGSMRMCRSPKLIAACRVLHRLLMPRHSPCALISLTVDFSACRKILFWFSELCRSQKNSYCSNCSCYPKFHNISFQNSYAALPSVALLLLFSIVQFSRCRSPVKDRIKTLKDL